jgi:hypothetical protein
MKKTREQKRGEYERWRRKRFLYLKNTGQYENFLNRFSSNKKEAKEVKISLWDRIKQFIKRIFRK